MTPFLDDETFLLQTETARRLYHDHARPQPIYDYHNHLPPQDIAANRTFANLFDIWLAGDHYKWRAMRANGIAEQLITGNATPWEKFAAFARTVPKTLRNPLYHWTHLELRRTFGITELLEESTAKSIWDRANEQLADLPVRALFKKFNVVLACTTDDPADSLEHHRTANAVAGTRLYAAFRPDKAMAVDQPAVFNAWLAKLSVSAGKPCDTLDQMLGALRDRHAFFHSVGCRLSDHGLNHAAADDCTDGEAATIFNAARNGHRAEDIDAAKFRSHLMLFFGRLDAERGWTKQLHVGAIRNNSSRGLHHSGPDTGFDSIGDFSQIRPLAKYMDTLDRQGQLPKMVLYNVNPNDNYALATMAGNFQDGGTPGKIQFGSGWWFLDQKQGMQWQLDALSNTGLLSRFVGMLTDSRSFLSFPRHEYFRRILCDLIGRDVENGELPNDEKLIGGMVEDICFGNAARFFGMELPGWSEESKATAETPR